MPQFIHHYLSEFDITHNQSTNVIFYSIAVVNVTFVLSFARLSLSAPVLFPDYQRIKLINYWDNNS